MIISILNEKGGVGKTTLSLNLARGMGLKYPSRQILIDSDPQGSSSIWAAHASPSLLKVFPCAKPTLDKAVKPLSYQYDCVWIDGAPAINELAIAAIRCSDIILIPVQPSAPDVWATENMARLVGERIAWSGGKVKAAFIIQRKIPNTLLSKEIRGVLNTFWLSHRIAVFESSTTQRVIYSSSLGKGLTVLDEAPNEAAKEINKIVDELREFGHEYFKAS